MSMPTDETRDTIAWRQIFVGYGLVLMILLLSVLLQLGLEDRDQLQTLGTIAVVVVVGAATLLAGPARALHKQVLAARPELDDQLQWAAIIALLLLSGATVVHGIMVWPASGWN